VLLILAALCFFIAAFVKDARVNLIALGLFLGVLIELIGGR
jgi:hypothetical protein